MAQVNIFGDPIEETSEETSEVNVFGDPIEEALAPEESMEERTRKYGGIYPPRPIGEEILEEYVRPAAQAGGAIIGTVAGAGAGAVVGAPTGPGALGTVSVGGITGGGIGFAIGDEAVDLMANWMGYKKPQPLMLELQESAEDIRTGITYELAGHTVAATPGTVGKGWNWLKSKFTKGGVTKRAGEVIAAMTDKGPVIAKNWDEAKALEKSMPGLKFDLGQLTGEPGIVKFADESAEGITDIIGRQAQQKAENTKAIDDFIKRHQGIETRKDIISPLKAKEALLAKETGIATDVLEKAMPKKPTTGPTEGGKAMFDIAQTREKEAREIGGKMFKDVPDQKQIVDDIYDEFNKILKPKHPNEGPEKFPKVLKRAVKNIEESIKDDKVPTKNWKNDPKLGTYSFDERGATGQAIDIADSGKFTAPQLKAKRDIIDKKVEKLMEAEKYDEVMQLGMRGQMWREAAEIMEGQKQWKGVLGPARETREAFYAKKGYGKLETGEPIMTLDHLQGLRSEILEDARIAEKRNAAPSLIARLYRAVEVIDEKLGGKVSGKGTPSDELKAAQKYWRENVVEKFGGATKEVIRGKEAGYASVANKYFKAGPAGEKAATEFMSAIGDDPTAKAALKEHIDQNFLDSVKSDKTGEVTQAAFNRWKKRYRHALKKLGLENEYDSIEKARQTLDRAHAVSKEFEKSATSRILGGDVNDIVKNAFAGTGSKREAAKDLLSQVKSDKKAIVGLQNAMIDDMLTKTPLEKGMRELLTSAKMAEQFRKYDAAIKVVFKNAPEKVRAMHNVRRAMKRLEFKTPLPRGENRVKGVIENMATRYGHSRRTAAGIALDMMKYLGKKVGLKNINSIINKAILDPELAVGLAKAAKGGKTEKAMIPFMNRLAVLGITITENKEND